MSDVKTFDYFHELHLETLYCCVNECDVFVVQEEFGHGNGEQLLSFRCKEIDTCDRCKDTFCEEHFERSRSMCVGCLEIEEQGEKEREEEEQENRKRAREADEE